MDRGGPEGTGGNGSARENDPVAFGKSALHELRQAGSDSGDDKQVPAGDGMVSELFYFCLLIYSIIDQVESAKNRLAEVTEALDLDDREVDSLDEALDAWTR